MSKQIRLGAIFWVLTAEFFLAQFLAQATYPNYSLVDMDISLLGVTACDSITSTYACSPRHFIFNAGMVLNGILILLGVWLTRRLWPVGPLTSVALWLLAVGSGLGALLVGAFPVNLFLEGHLAGAVLTLFVASLGIMVMGAVIWPVNRTFALYSLFTGAISVVAVGLYLLEFYLGLGRGTMERIGAWSHTLWYMLTGTLILLGRFRPSAS